MVFMDHQNVYNGARRTFEFATAIHTAGQVNPLKVGQAIAANGTDRELVGVRIYAGMPDSRKQPQGHKARSRQVKAWAALPKVTPNWRPLQYPRDFGKDPKAIPKEKGIDVQLAIDFVMFALAGDFDIGVIFSADTDLRPPLAAVEQIKGLDAIEVAAWQPDKGYANRLTLEGSGKSASGKARPACTFLGSAAYKDARDVTDYNVP